MPLPPKLTKFSTASEVIASYDFFDFAQGVGIKQFYAAVMVGPTYKLTTNIIFSNTGAGIITAGGNTAGDFDFDGEFETTIDIGGDSIIQVPVVGFNGSSGSFSSLITITLYHVDASAVETSLGTFNRTVSGSPSSGVGSFFSVTGLINIARTTLKNGEKLRLNIVNTAPGNNQFIYFGVDPANRIGSGSAAQYFDTTQTIINLPIVI